MFRERRPGDALPHLLNALKEVESSVTLNHVAAVYSMAARRMAAARPTAMAQEQQALALAVKYFEAAAKKRAEEYTATPSCLSEFKQPLTQVLRSWGDALIWLGRAHQGRKVFESAEARQFWVNPLCRPNVNHAFQAQYDALTLPYILDEKDLLKAGSNIFSIVQESLLPPIVDSFRSVGTDGTQLWKPERAGLHHGHSWKTILFWANQKSAGVCNGAPDGSDAFAPACANLQRIVENTPILRTKSGQIKLSVMASGTIVRPHAGPTNARLRMHCSVDVPLLDDMTTYIRVGNEKRTWDQVQGSCFAFRESCEHEVKVSAEIGFARTILIIDFNNPFLEQQSGTTHEL